MITIQYRAGWPQEFDLIGRELKTALAGLATGIHHIGSTSVPGLAAKDIIDIQVSVEDFTDEIISRLEAIGFMHQEHISNDHRPPGMEHLPESALYKWFFHKAGPASNLHVRKVGAFNQRYPLLCRDYLRHNEAAAKAYEAVKINLARHFPNDISAYYDVKDPVFDVLMAGAEIWSTAVRWQPGDSDIPLL